MSGIAYSHTEDSTYLIVDWPKINVYLKRLASDPADQHILSRIADPFIGDMAST